MAPHFRNLQRFIGSRDRGVGVGRGRELLAVRFHVAAESDADLALVESLLQHASGNGIVSARSFRADAPEGADWLLLVDAVAGDHLESVSEAIGASLSTATQAGDISVERYGVIVSLAHEGATA
jgi:hypothetical protein